MMKKNMCPHMLDGSLTVDVVRAMNEQDGCPNVTAHGDLTGRSIDGMDQAEKKNEYYGLLLKFLPQIMAILEEFRVRFPDGLVRYGGEDFEIISSIDTLRTAIDAAVDDSDFLAASYALHDHIARTINVATREWIRRGAPKDPDFHRLQLLVDEERRQRFGDDAAQERIADAMNQTVFISASFQRFIFRILSKEASEGLDPQRLRSIFTNSLNSAMKLTNLHLLRTWPIRVRLGRETVGGGVVELYEDDTFFQIIDETLELVGTALVNEMSHHPIDVSDGRIGCPGRRHVPSIWSWIDQLSEKYAYSLV